MGKPVVLCILDGWGYREGGYDNAIELANTPTWDKLWQTFPHTLLKASGPAVGLPPGQMGNSEVGHLHLGAGRLVEQDLPRINQLLTAACATGGAYAELCARLKSASKPLHLMGLFSPGGVHSHENHVKVLLEAAKDQGVPEVVLHLFLDGRDVSPRSAHASLIKLQAWISQIGIGYVASLIGRYYAMDRDNRWDRVQQAYELLTQGKADYQAASAEAGLKWAYAHDKSDEFTPPISIVDALGKTRTVQPGDGVCFFNFRADRARELTRAFIDPDFNCFSPREKITLAGFLSMTEYASDLPTQVLFPPQHIANGLSDVLAQHGLTQLRIAETEKYAHVTFFFNGGQETPVKGESRQLIPSPKVATYDLKPEMSAYELTAALVTAIKSQQYDVIICNYANPDMVGHTGDIKASVHAVEVIDDCLEKVWQALDSVGGEALITADHGNIERLFDSTTGQPHTAHTTELVPLVYLGARYKLSDVVGTLADVAPSLLHLLKIAPPPEMSGVNLLQD